MHGEFGEVAQRFRGELLALCYRMLGSVDDAEDAVQETYLRAWKAYPRFAGRSSVRTWLYQIAVNACLRSMERNSRRPLPSGLGEPSSNPAVPVDRATGDIAWLQPFPGNDPAAIAETRASMRLAFVAALQHLAPRQRVVLILRDVLDWRAAEVATLLKTSTAAVNSLLQRARTQLEALQLGESDVTEPSAAEERRLLDRYARAFTEADVNELLQILTEDAAWEMPPMRTWFTGRETIVRFIAARLGAPGRYRMISTVANGQPAFASYLHSSGTFRAHALHVLTLTGSGISRIVAFMDPAVFTAFGLPVTHD